MTDKKPELEPEEEREIEEAAAAMVSEISGLSDSWTTTLRRERAVGWLRAQRLAGIEQGRKMEQAEHLAIYEWARRGEGPCPPGEIASLRAQVETLRHAVGCASTAAPFLVANPDDPPVWMQEMVRQVLEQIETLTRENIEWQDRCLTNQTERDEALANVERLRKQNHESAAKADARVGAAEAELKRLQHREENETRQNLIEELSGVVGDYERHDSSGVLGVVARLLIERVRKLGLRPRISFSG